VTHRPVIKPGSPGPKLNALTHHLPNRSLGVTILLTGLGSGLGLGFARLICPYREMATVITRVSSSSSTKSACTICKMAQAYKMPIGLIPLIEYLKGPHKYNMVPCQHRIVTAPYMLFEWTERIADNVFSQLTAMLKPSKRVQCQYIRICLHFALFCNSLHSLSYISHFYRRKVSGGSTENSAKNKGSRERAFLGLYKNLFERFCCPKLLPLAGFHSIKGVMT